MKKFLKSFTPYQITYLVVVFSITALFIIFMPDLMLDDMSNTLVVVCSVVATLANPICELLISKQSKWNFVVDALLIEIPELIICIALGWYTIAIVTMVFWIPIDIASLLKWRKNPDREEEELTVVKRLSWKQDVFVILAIIAFGFGVGTLISLIPGAADSYLDAFAAAFGMANGILLLLRYSEQWYAWFITLIFYTIMYINSGTYIMLITVAAMFVNTCYGFVKWLIYIKRHADEKKIDDTNEVVAEIAAVQEDDWAEEPEVAAEADVAPAVAENADEVTEAPAEEPVAAKAGKRLSPETKEKAIAIAKKSAPVVAAVVVTAALAAVIHKNSKAKRNAKVRKSLLDLLR